MLKNNEVTIFIALRGLFGQPHIGPPLSRLAFSIPLGRGSYCSNTAHPVLHLISKNVRDVTAVRASAMAVAPCGPRLLVLG
jgi:hypothetical protein